MKLVFAGSRLIGFKALKLLLSKNVNVTGLILSDEAKTEQFLQVGIRTVSFKKSLDLLTETKPDYLLSVHFPHVFKPEALKIPTIGCLNLHPSLLPFNRGRHSYSWAIIDHTPHGATLHWMDKGVDTGDIALQVTVPVLPSDTTHTLYQRTCEAELDLLNIAVPKMIDKTLPRIKQDNLRATSHKGKDLELIKKLNTYDLTLIDKLRALTTLRLEEAAYFEVDGKKFCVIVDIKEQP